MNVKDWYEKVLISTYETGKLKENPMLLERYVYRGSSGVVYLHPVIEKMKMRIRMKLGTCPAE